MAIVIIISVANNMIVLTGPASRYGADIPLSVIGIVMKVFGIVVVFSVHRLEGYHRSAESKHPKVIE